MDPLSIAASCTALVTTIAKISVELTSFSRRVREARNDVDLVVRELVSLTTTLEYMAGDINDNDCGKALPSSLLSQIKNILAGCDNVIIQIAQTISKFDGDGVIVRSKWAISGQGDMEKLRSSLEAHKSALGIGLDMLLL